MLAASRYEKGKAQKEKADRGKAQSKRTGPAAVGVRLDADGPNLEPERDGKRKEAKGPSYEEGR